MNHRLECVYVWVCVFICSWRLGFLAAMQLTWACGLRLVSSDFIENSFTDLREGGQLSWLMTCGKWSRPVLDSNPRCFYCRGFVALHFNDSATVRDRRNLRNFIKAMGNMIVLLFLHVIGVGVIMSRIQAFESIVEDWSETLLGYTI